jgi:hypothetical protein
MFLIYFLYFLKIKDHFAVFVSSPYGLSDHLAVCVSPLICFYGAQIGSGAHPSFYPMGTGDDFPGDKAAGE